MIPSPFAPFFTDPEIGALHDEPRMLANLVRFERELAAALGACGEVPGEAASAALDALDSFAPDVDAVRRGTDADGVPVPELVRQMKRHVGEPGISAIHVGATSQDVIDTATALALRDTSDALDARLARLIDALSSLAAAHGDAPLMGRTRMQAALPIRVRDRVDAWREPLARHRERLAQLRVRVEVLSYAGPVGLGTRAANGPSADVAAHLARALGLGTTERSLHSTRDGLVEYGGWLGLVAGSLGKLGQDVCLMAQQGIDEIRLAGGGKSSAMAHKANPVLAEKLVGVARWSAAQVGGLHQALVHEQERSGAAWALEWMILPPVAVATGRALADAIELVGRVERIGSP